MLVFNAKLCIEEEVYLKNVSDSQQNITKHSNFQINFRFYKTKLRLPFEVSDHYLYQPYSLWKNSISREITSRDGHSIRDVIVQSRKITHSISSEKRERGETGSSAFFLVGGSPNRISNKLPFRRQERSNFRVLHQNEKYGSRAKLVCVSVSSTGNQSFLRVEWVCTEQEKYFLKLECCYWITNTNRSIWNRRSLTCN